MYAWEHAKPKGKWIQVSADNRVLDAMTKERKSRGPRAATKAQKEKLTCTTCLKKQQQMKRERQRTDKLGDKLEAFLTRKEGKDEATGLMEEMRKNVVVVQQKKF